MRKTYYYYYEMQEKKDWLHQSLDELSKKLSKPPVEIQFSFAELPIEYESDIRKILEREEGCIYNLEKDLCDYYKKDLYNIENNHQDNLNTLIICHNSCQSKNRYITYCVDHTPYNIRHICICQISSWP